MGWLPFKKRKDEIEIPSDISDSKDDNPDSETEDTSQENHEELPSFTQHTEALIKVESERIITLLLKHIEELQDNLNSKLKELEKLSKNTAEVKETIKKKKVAVKKPTPKKTKTEKPIIKDAAVEEAKPIEKVKEITIPERIDPPDSIPKKSEKPKLPGKIKEPEKIKPKSKQQKTKKTLKEREYFYLENGSVLKSIEDLYGEILSISDSVFKTHVSKDKNDFVNWIQYVFNEKELADKVRKAKTKENIKSVLKKHLIK